MGPQNAVVDAVSRPVTMSSRLRVSLMFTPRLAAYQKYSDDEAHRYEKCEIGQLLAGDSAEISHAPNRIGVYPFGRCEIVE